MEKDHTQCQHDIHDRHERNEFGGDIADTLDAADQDQGNDDRQSHADDQVDKLHSICRQYVKAAQSRINGSSDRIDLCGITGTEHSQHTESGEQIRQEVPFFIQSVLNIIHRAAYQISLCIGLAEVYSKCYFGELGAHAEQRRYPHPEYRSGTANGDGTCHTGDVAGAHGARQCGAHRLKGGHGAIGSVLFAEHAPDGGFDGVGEFADLQKARAHAEQQSHTDDAHHGGDAPDKAVDRLIDGRDRF